MKKKVVLLLSAVLLLAQISQMLGIISRVQAEDIQQNLITNVALTVLDESGQTVTGTVYEQGAPVQLDFDWELPNASGYGDGATFTFDLLPENVFAILNDIEGELPLEDGESVGTFKVDWDTNKITMTFNDFISLYDDVHGKITIKTKFDKDKMAGSTHQVINFPVQSGEQTVELDFKPDVSSTIDKSGTPDKALNAQNINWTVNVNKKLETVQHAVVTDPIPYGLTLDTDSVKVYNLAVNLDGSVSVTDAVDSGRFQVGKTEDGNDFQILFTDENISTAYQIQYSTHIDGGASFTNTAVLSGDGYTPESASATVNVSRGAELAKTAGNYDKVTQTVNWQIQFNYGEENVAKEDARLTDYFNDTQQLVPGSLKVYNVTFGSGGDPVKGSEYSGFVVEDPAPEEGKEGFSLQFNSDIHSAFIIEYQTKAKEPVFQNTNVNNTVTWGTYEASASKGLEQVFGIKYFDKANYAAQTADWHIDINGNNVLMNNATIKDEFTGGGLELDPTTLEVRNASGDLVDPSAYTVTYTGDPADYTQGFELSFANAINEKYSISYTTKYTFANLTSGDTFPNKAVLTWTDAKGEQSLTTTAGFNPNPYTKSNGYKSGAYNPLTKEITWTIGVNYNRKQLSEASVVDELEANQKYIPGSIAVYEMNIAEDGKVTQGSPVEDGSYTVNYNPSSNKLTVGFNSTINSAYILVFKTSLAGNLINTKVDNTAILMNGNVQESKGLDSSVNIPHGGEYVSKTGKQNGEVVDWQVDINRNQSTVSDAQLIDTPSTNQILLQDSFHLYSASVDENGEIGKDEEMAKGTDYALTFENNEQGVPSFTLSFMKEISEPYILEYQSLINANDGESLTNSVKFKGNNTETIDKESNQSIIVGVSSGSGSGSGVRGSLTVIKVDKEDANLVLPGAEFKLERKLNGKRILIGTQTTDEEGKVTFTKLLAGDYVLTELTAPSGYTIDTPDYDLTISSSNLNPVQQVSDTKIPDPTPTPTPTPAPSTGGGGSTPEPTPTPTPAPSGDPSQAPGEASPTPVPTPVPSEGPAPSNDTVVTIKGTPISGVIPVPDGAAPRIGMQPKHGQAAVKPDGRWTYTPDGEFTGKDKFSVVIQLPNGEEEITIAVDVVPKGGVTLSAGGGGGTGTQPLLPQTGEGSHLGIQLAGLFFVLLGVTGIWVIRRKRMKVNKATN
ncbi:hypothetical protein AWM70_21250 [Paenibacillus yonginensis]|uniref:Gram-positive cocci surface proteins LPxTG domain-containing protein n=1 Tax=Paenibacillus yonginensis TaxID=1462996 RepID=A0A1B1N5V0_9BACL|nr:collagen binding domain-containing protein [Paenibacillus yonginensis]ANS76796.1 hypothetical protein AWM70_21250 [Paenibacillus yonginensis]